MIRLRFLAVVSLLVLGAPARAADQPPATTTTTTTTTPRAHDEGAYAAPAIAIPVRVYGTIKPTLIVSNGLESFGFQTLGATTAASNPVFDADAPRLSFQIMQSRFGIKAGEGTPVVGILELDFLHLEQSSPVQQAFPRLRLAFIEWTPAPGHKLLVGQAWDIFSPLAPHTFNVVPAMFQSGNSGFLRHQIAWFETFGNVETAVAVGLVAPNASPNLSFVELGLTPSVAVRAAWKPRKGDQVGVAAIASSLELGPDARRPAAGGSVFADLTFASAGKLNFRLETYGGANLANLGALTLGHGHVDADVYELGGFVSANLPLPEGFAVFATLAAATVLNPDDLQLGYQSAHDDVAAVRTAATGPGLVSNSTARCGGSFSPLKGFSLLVEPFVFSSKHKLDVASGLDPLRLGWGVEAGALYSF
ncbi:MAG: hypothetical protein Q8O67_12930 [Deltaproteobacteria bacterium]|nr:hypothetical protein [Deltaproteobacteria bacterium]